MTTSSTSPGLDARARERLADARRAELVRVDVLERAAEAADRGAHAADEHDRIAVRRPRFDATGALGAGGALRAPAKHRRPVRGERCSGMQAHLIDRGGAQDVGVDRALLERLAGEKGFWWLDLHGPTDELLGLLGEVFGFHPLAIEDAMNFGQRPKLDEYDDVRLPCRLRRRARRGRPRRDPLLLLRALPRHRAARRLPRFRRGAGAPRAPSRPAPRARPCPLPGRRRAGRQLLPAPERRSTSSSMPWRRGSSRGPIRSSCAASS